LAISSQRYHVALPERCAIQLDRMIHYTISYSLYYMEVAFT